MDLSRSLSLQNLMRAFAGECQARSRYTMAAEEARKQKLVSLEKLFLFTAGQELAHARVFLSHLQAAGVSSVDISAGYPVEPPGGVLASLRAAEHNEQEEALRIYPGFAAVAREEGLIPIALSFEKIGAIEARHQALFGETARRLESGSLYSSREPSDWMCLNCGHIVHGTEAPGRCPVCAHEQGWFVPVGEAPFS